MSHFLILSKCFFTNTTRVVDFGFVGVYLKPVIKCRLRLYPWLDSVLSLLTIVNRLYLLCFMKLNMRISVVDYKVYEL